MAVYLIADVKVTDDNWLPAYAASVHDLVHKHGGKYLARSGNVKTLEGKPLDTTLIALMEFPSARCREAFAADPKYAPFAAARQQRQRQPVPTDRRYRSGRNHRLSAEGLRRRAPQPIPQQDLKDEKDETLCDRTRHTGRRQHEPRCSSKDAAMTSCDALAKLYGKIQWEHSYVTGDKTFCIYLADGEATIREHARLSGFPANKITEVSTVIDPMTAFS